RRPCLDPARTPLAAAGAAGVAAGKSVGGCSPGETSQAMVWPTGTTSPSCDFTPARTPSALASTSTTALSVSTSRRTSPLLTVSPSFFSQETIFPVSCAISSAGITMLVAIIGRKVLLPLRTPSVRWEQSRLRAAAKMEWERASLRYALPVLPDQRMLLRQSRMRFPPSLHIVHILHRR